MPTRRDDDNRIHIPEECRVVKDWFRERPNRDLVKYIKRFIAADPRPYLWPGHTHTKPPPGSIPVYLDEFDLPAAALKSGRLAPCPCCTPEHPKYGIAGKIGWFPGEGVVRLIGPDCFAALNKDAHHDAVEDMRREKRRRQDIDYLLKNQDRLLAMPEILDDAYNLAESLDCVRADLCRTFEERLDIPIWQSVKTGKLQVWEKFSERDRHGNMRELSRLRAYAPLRGFGIFDPEVKSYTLRVKQFLGGIAFIQAEGWSGRIVTMDDSERRQTARLISSIVTRARTLFAAMRELQHFFSDLTMATMRTWACRDDCPTPFIFRRDGCIILIGKRENAMFRVALPHGINDELQEIDVPLLGEMPDEQPDN